MQRNASISEYPLLHRLNTFYEKIDIILDGKTLEKCVSLKSLGILIDNKTQWTAHINDIIRKVNYKLSTISQISKFCSYENSKMLVFATCYSLLRYCAIIWGTAKRGDLCNIDKCIKRCARLVLKKAKTILCLVNSPLLDGFLRKICIITWSVCLHSLS